MLKLRLSAEAVAVLIIDGRASIGSHFANEHFAYDQLTRAIELAYMKNTPCCESIKPNSEA
jgi:hypothetical protein